MNLSKLDIDLIGERSASLTERLQGGFTPQNGGEAIGARRLARWKQLSADNNSELFACRLKAYGMEQVTDAELCARLSLFSYPSGSDQPDWVSFLSRMVSAVAESNSAAHRTGDSLSPRRKTSRIPYEDLYRPIVECAWPLAAGASTHAAKSISQAAQQSLKAYLLRRISAVFSVAVHAAFLARKAFGISGMMPPRFGLTPTEAANGGPRFYHDFVKEQRQDGLRSLFLRYPAAARLIAQISLYWVGFVQEFLQRLENDQAELANRFNGGSPLGSIVALKAGVSDPHRKGRSVLILAFDDGLQLVYKPRPLAIDQQFFAMTAELNMIAPGLDLRVLKIVDRQRYGWMEFARHSPCPNKRAASRFYRRAGSLACLTHWLQGIDFHRENVVASGEHPVLVDLESLAHPQRAEELSVADNGSGSFDQLGNSVLRTGLLPLWQQRFPDSGFHDLSGFNGQADTMSVISSHQWKNVNTDRMQLTLVKRRHFHAAHRAVLDNHLLSMRSYEREVVQGYREMSKLLTGKHQPALDGRREQMCRATRRRIKRPTMIYGVLLQASVEPKNLMHGVDRSIELTALPCAQGDEEEWLAELESLELLDVPYFQCGSQDDKDGPAFPYPATLSSQVNVVKLAARQKLGLDGRVVRRMSDLRTRQRPT